MVEVWRLFRRRGGCSNEGTMSSRTGSRGNSAFYGSSFYPGANSTPMNTSFDTPVSSRENSSETTPNSSVGLHQKLDILISGNRDQRKAIDSLKAENETLRAQLETVVQDLSVLKEVQNTLPATITRTKMKLPPAVSVSYS